MNYERRGEYYEGRALDRSLSYNTLKDFFSQLTLSWVESGLDLKTGEVGRPCTSICFLNTNNIQYRYFYVSPYIFASVRKSNMNKSYIADHLRLHEHFFF